MDANKIFAKALKTYYSGKDVGIITDYDKARKILKLFLSLPETKILNIELSEPLWDGYEEPWTIDIDSNGKIWCQKSICEKDNKPYQSEGYYIIDSSAIGEHSPNEFVIDSKMKVV